MAPFIPPSDPSQPYNELPPGDRPPTTSGDKVILYLFIGLFTGLMTLEVFVDVSPARMTAIFFLGLWIPLTVLHEAGHAIVARILGWHVEGVHLGFGRVRRVFRVSGIRVEVRTWPIVGMVRIRPSNTKSARIKNALIYAAGPGIEGIAIALVISIIGWDVLTGPTTGYGLALAQSFCLAAITGIIFNLLPFSSDPNTVTDGMGILMSPFLKPTHFEIAMIQPQLEQSQALIEDGRVDEALERLERLAEQYPDIVLVHAGIARCLVEQGHSGEALMRLQAFIRGRADMKPEVAEAFLTDLRSYIQRRKKRG